MNIVDLDHDAILYDEGSVSADIEFYVFNILFYTELHTITRQIEDEIKHKTR